MQPLFIAAKETADDHSKSNRQGAKSKVVQNHKAGL